MKEQKKPDADGRNLTLQVQNPRVEELLKRYGEEKSGENLQLLIEALDSARFLVPAHINRDQQAVPCLLDTPEGVKLISAYTCLERISRVSGHTALVNMPFTAICEMAAKSQGPMGVILNPVTDNLVLTQALLQRIRDAWKLAGNVSYEASERRRFETEVLPGKLFELGKSMVEELCGKKEAYIDHLFEEAYEQKRRYPYLPEDFSVMVMNISDDLLLVQVDLPNRDRGERYCEHIYFAWNEAAGSGRYFMIEWNRPKKARMLGEVDGAGERVDHGEAPTEGTELQRIMEIVRENKKEI